MTSPFRLVQTLRRRSKSTRREAFAVYRAARDPRVPFHVKVCAAAVLAYVVSPIDLIPDFIPVLGNVDDAIVVPIGLALIRRMMPASVMAETLIPRPVQVVSGSRGSSGLTTVVLSAGWLVALGLTVILFLHLT